MAEEHRVPDAGQLPRPASEVFQRKGFANKRAAQRVRSRTVQNEMRDVLGRITTAVAQRFLHSRKI